MALLRRYLSRWLTPLLCIFQQYLYLVASNLGCFFNILCEGSSKREKGSGELPPLSVSLMEMPLWLDIAISERLTSTLRPLRSVVTEVLCSLCDLVVALYDLQEYISLVVDENGQRKLQPFVDNMIYFSMSWISSASDPSGSTANLTMLDIVAGCRPPAPILPDLAYYSSLVSPIRDEIRQLHASFHPLCHIGVVSPTGAIPTSMRSGSERLLLVDCKRYEGELGSILPEDINIKMQLRIEQLKRCMNRLARSCAELDIEFHRSDLLLQYMHNCKQSFRVYGGYAIKEVRSLQLDEYQTRNDWSRILHQASSSEDAVFKSRSGGKMVSGMYRVLVFSSTVMRLASLVEFAVGECERAYEFNNPSSAGNKKTAKEGDGIWTGSKTKSDCFAWAQSVAVRALTGSALDRAVGDFCVKAIRSADFPLNSWEEVGDLARCIDRLLSDEWIDLLLPPGTCRIEYTDFQEKGYIEVLMKAVKELKRSIDEVVDASKETGGLPAERRTRNAIQAVWRQLTRAHVEGYLDHFGSFMAQYAAMVQTPLSECLERSFGQEVRVDLPAMNLYPLYASGPCLRLVEIQPAKPSEC